MVCSVALPAGCCQGTALPGEGSPAWLPRPTTCKALPRHPDAAIYLSQPGTGEIPGARQLGESGDDPHRYATAKARKNYAVTSPVTRQSGTKKTVMAGSSATTGSPTPCTG